MVREAISGGDFRTLRAVAIEESRVMAEIIGETENYHRVLKAAESSPTKWSAALFLFEARSLLSEEKRGLLKATLISLLIQLSSQISARGIRPTETFLTSFEPSLEEIEVEETIENALGKKKVEFEDIVMVGKRPKKRSFMLMLDISNSMKYEKMLLAVLAVGVFALKLQGERYSIVTFSKDAEIIKPMDWEMPVSALLDKMLDLKTGGTTNLRKGLEVGLDELSKNVAHEKLAVLVTDGWVTEGHDPLEVAEKYPKLHVLQVPLGMGGGDSEMCNNLVRKGRGKCVYVDEFECLPRAIIEILK